MFKDALELSLTSYEEKEIENPKVRAIIAQLEKHEEFTIKHRLKRLSVETDEN